jgi:hypothetical protein
VRGTEGSDSDRLKYPPFPCPVLGDCDIGRVGPSTKAYKPAKMLSTRRLGVVIVSGEISVFVTGHVVDVT